MTMSGHSVSTLNDSVLRASGRGVFGGCGGCNTRQKPGSAPAAPAAEPLEPKVSAFGQESVSEVLTRSLNASATVRGRFLYKLMKKSRNCWTCKAIAQRTRPGQPQFQGHRDGAHTPLLPISR